MTNICEQLNKQIKQCEDTIKELTFKCEELNNESRVKEDGITMSSFGNANSKVLDNVVADLDALIKEQEDKINDLNKKLDEEGCTPCRE